MSSAMSRPLASGSAVSSGGARGPAGATLLILAGYLLGAVALTWRLWADPASVTAAGNRNDANYFAWFIRYDAIAVLHGHLPALVTTAQNVPQGINLMWNNALLLPGILLTPVTAAAGPQASLTVLVTLGFAGSAASLFWVLRRWGVSRPAAALGGAVYGFSPALLHAAIGHYHLQFEVLPPLIIDAGLRLCLGSSRPLRGGAWLGLLAAAQLFISEEMLLITAITALLLVAVLALSRPRAAIRLAGPAAAGLAVAGCVALLLTGWALWRQFHGPLTSHGSAFQPDRYLTHLPTFVTPSALQLFHTGASAATAAAQDGAPEYLGYLGVPLIAVLVIAAVGCWRQLAVRATAVTLAVLELLSVGAHPFLNATQRASVTLPWAWLGHLPLVSGILPDRLSILADGAAAALLAFAVDLTVPRLARSRLASHTRRATAIALSIAVLAVAPLLPLPLPATPAAPLPAGWTRALDALALPAGASVLVVPVPTPVLSGALRWQAASGEQISLVGGYFIGPDRSGGAFIEGAGLPPLVRYLNALWAGHPRTRPPGTAAVRADLATWHPAAVVAVAGSRPRLRRYLDQILGPPSVSDGAVLAWRVRQNRPD